MWEVTGLDVDVTDSSIEYDSIELTAIRRTDMENGPAQIQYNQFQVQSDQWSSRTTLNRSYFLPPRTSSVIIVLPAEAEHYGSQFLGSQRLESYRFTVNGESVTNRAVNYMPQSSNQGPQDAKAEAGSSLHYDLISNTMMNMGVRFSSLQECVYDQIVPVNTPPTANAGLIGYATLGDCPRKRCYMLALPIPESDAQTQLTVELEGHFDGGNPAHVASGSMELYSYVTSVI